MKLIKNRLLFLFAILLFYSILYNNYNEKARAGLTKNKKNAIFVL